MQLKTVSEEITQSWHDRAAIIPGRSNTRSKSPGRMYPIGRGPLYYTNARGARIQGDDGKWYLDMGCGLGAVSIGYDLNPRPIVAPVSTLPHIAEILASEAVLEAVAPWASHVRCVRTGSEAMTGALMVAQRATGRKEYWRLRGSYHGWHPQWSPDLSRRLRAKCGTCGRDVALSNNRGSDVLANFIAAVLANFVAPHKCPTDLNGGRLGCPADSTTIYQPSTSDTRLFDVGEVPAFSAEAAVIIEPPRWESFTARWLQEVVDAAHAAGALVIFDEMIYGGRWALGGATEYYGVTPDLACYGKAFGNGSPVAFIVGRDELAEHGEAVSGTYSGDANALMTAASVIAEYQRQDVISWMRDRGRQLRAGLKEAATGFKVRLEGSLVHQRLVFDAEHMGLEFSAQMASRGILFPPYAVNFMRAHSEVDIDLVVEAAAESFAAMAEGNA